MTRQFFIVAGRVHPGERIAVVIAEAARQAVHDELEAGMRRDERYGLTELGWKATESR